MSSPSSPVVALLQHVYDHANAAKGPSWRLLNEALSTTLRMAILCQFNFERDDFERIAKRFKFHYWCGNDGEMSGEWYYHLAVNNRNRSACIAFEQWKGRKPWMLNGERLALGSEFFWSEKPVSREGSGSILRVFVTSISGERLGFCCYDNPGNHQKGKPSRRFSLDFAEFKSAVKEGRAALTIEHFGEWLSKQEEAR